MNKYRFYIEDNNVPVKYEAFAGSLKELWTKVLDTQLAHINGGGKSTYVFNGMRSSVRVVDIKRTGGKVQIGESIRREHGVKLMIELVK